MIDRVGEEQRICEKSLELRGLLDRAQVPFLQLVEHRGRNRRVPPHLVQHHGDEPNRSARRLPPRRRRRRQAEESAWSAARLRLPSESGTSSAVHLAARGRGSPQLRPPRSHVASVLVTNEASRGQEPNNALGPGRPSKSCAGSMPPPSPTASPTLATAMTFHL